jgi:transposase InsO family protein
MCKCFSVSRSAYYDWLSTPPSAKKIEDQQLIEKIRVIFVNNKNNYGTRRIKKELAKKGLIISRKRIGGLMKKAGLYCKAKRRFKITTDSKHNLPISPNLLQRNFTANSPNETYVGDITYIPTKAGWLYLAIVIDLFSRQVVGWSMKKHMRASLVNDALLMAIWRRKPKRGLVWHTDRGSQYASNSHRDLLKVHGIKQSMSRKGDCWDNAVAESFFHTLKIELVYQSNFKTTEEAKNAIFEYIEVYYNKLRMHSANDYLSPVEYEKARKFA